MGIYDRDYLRDEPRRGWGRPGGASAAFGAMRMWSITTWLIVINVGVFLLDSIWTVRQTAVDQYGNVFNGPPVHPIYLLGYFSIQTAIVHLQLWRLITFQFLHAGVEHILFNMIALFFFGPLMEEYLGPRQYLAFYLLCGMAGPVVYAAMVAIGVIHYDAPLIGASAGIFGILIAAAQVAPDTTVLIYGLIPMRLRTLAWVLLAIAAYVVFFNGHNAGGQAAHLGGAAAGYLLLQNQQVLNVFDFGRRRRMRIR